MTLRLHLRLRLRLHLSRSPRVHAWSAPAPNIGYALNCWNSGIWFFFLLLQQQKQKRAMKRVVMPVKMAIAAQATAVCSRSSAGLYGSNAHSGVSSAGTGGGRATGGARRCGAHLIIL